MEESTFYPHYEIRLLIEEPIKPIKPINPNGTTLYKFKRFIKGQSTPRKGSIPKTTIKEWLDENIGKDYYHLGIDKVVVYSEINVMAVRLRWQ